MGDPGTSGSLNEYFCPDISTSKKTPAKRWLEYFHDISVGVQLQGRAIDKLDEARTNVDDPTMFVRQPNEVFLEFGSS